MPGTDLYLARKHIVSDQGVFTANTNITKKLFGCPPGGPKIRVESISFCGLAVPLDNDGTMLIQLFRNDLAAGVAARQLMTNFDAELMTPANQYFKGTLNTETTANELTLGPGDSLSLRFDNNSAAIDTNPNIFCILEYIVVPQVQDLNLPT